MRIVVIGLPASGKSTLTAALSDEDPRIGTFGVRRFFAAQVERGTALGEQVRHLVAAQAWLPDDVVVEAFRAELRRGAVGDRFIVEGMPGNLRQAELLTRALTEEGVPLHAAVHVDTPARVCAQRAATRVVCPSCDGGSHPVPVGEGTPCPRCGVPTVRRDTDAEEAFLRRLAVQEPLVPPLVEYYRGDLLLTVDGTLPPDEMIAGCRSRLAVRTGEPA